MYDVKSVVRLFTDHFRKDPESNTYKLMQLFSDELQLLKETNDRIMDWRDIDQAEGMTLDLIGKNVLQPRGQLNDAAYRIMLKTKIARNLADGTLNGFIRAIAYVLQIDASSIKVVELWNLLDDPAALAVEAIPTEKIRAAGLTTNDFEEILRSFVGAGVKLLLLASGANEQLVYSGKSYTFDVSYRITNRFCAGRIPGAIAPVDISPIDEVYTFDIQYPRTNNFRSGER